jgi:hypothetical protein
MAEQCGIPESQAGNILKFAGLVAEVERHQCIDILMRLHERSGEVHNHYKFAAEKLREMK